MPGEAGRKELGIWLILITDSCACRGLCGQILRQKPFGVVAPIWTRARVAIPVAQEFMHMLGVHKHLVLLRHFVLTRNFLPREEKMGKKYLSYQQKFHDRTFQRPTDRVEKRRYQLRKVEELAWQSSSGFGLPLTHLDSCCHGHDGLQSSCCLLKRYFGSWTGSLEHCFFALSDCCGGT